MTAAIFIFAASSFPIGFAIGYAATHLRSEYRAIDEIYTDQQARNGRTVRRPDDEI